MAARLPDRDGSLGLTTSRVKERSKAAFDDSTCCACVCLFVLFVRSRSPLDYGSLKRVLSLSLVLFPSRQPPNKMPKNPPNSNAASRHSLRRNQVSSFLSSRLTCLLMLVFLEGLSHLPQTKAGTYGVNPSLNHANPPIPSFSEM